MTLQANNPVAPLSSQQTSDAPLKIVGGSNFGRYEKISAEATYNMIVSDKFLVPYAGYKNVLMGSLANLDGFGRGSYASTDGDFIIAVIGSNIYKISPLFDAQQVNIVNNIPVPMKTNIGDVFITENNGNEIVVTDYKCVYVYNWLSGLFSGSDVAYAPNDFVFGTPTIYGSPGYCSFQNGRVVIAVPGTQQWVLSQPNSAAVDWPNDKQHQGFVQSKPGFAQAAVPVPGGGNNIMVFGSTVAESWTDQGLALFPYQKNTTFNVDYGVLNPSSIAQLDNTIVWIATNETSGPTVMYTDGGGKVHSISTDGIDYRLANLEHPNAVTGFLFRQDGHMIYQFTFNRDNVSLAYDFNTQLFSIVTDESLNYHPARQVVFFRNNYYFVSFNDANFYRFDTTITNIQYSETQVYEIPRIRITPPLRLDTQRNFIIRSVGFTIEQGQLNPSHGAVAAVDMAISRNGAQSFGNDVRVEFNLSGDYKNRFIYQRCGIANDATFRFRFSGFERFVATDGLIEVYQ